MATTYECKVITDTVDLRDTKKRNKYEFTIQEPADIFFYRSEMKLKCIQLDSRESPAKFKPGRITQDGEPKTSSKGKESKITYEPDTKTMPGRYKLEVVFKRNGKNGPKVCTKSADFRVVDTTPIGIFEGNGKTNYIINLNGPGDSWKKPVKLKVKGPRNQQINLKVLFLGDNVASFGTTNVSSSISGELTSVRLK